MREQKRIDIENAGIVSKYVMPIYKDLGIEIKEVVNPTTPEGSTLQKKGVDIIIEENGKEIYVDEKARIDYINRDGIPGFAFEISSINTDGVRRKAWLYAPDQLTHRYHLITSLEGEIQTIPLNGKYYTKIISLTNCIIRSIDKDGLLRGIHKYLSKERIFDYEGKIIDILENSQDSDKQKEEKLERLFNNIAIEENRIKMYPDELTVNGRHNGWFVYTLRKRERPLNLFLKYWYLENQCSARTIYPVTEAQ